MHASQWDGTAKISGLPRSPSKQGLDAFLHLKEEYVKVGRKQLVRSKLNVGEKKKKKGVSQSRSSQIPLANLCEPSKVTVKYTRL